MNSNRIDTAHSQGMKRALPFPDNHDNNKKLKTEEKRILQAIEIDGNWKDEFEKDNCIIS